MNSNLIAHIPAEFTGAATLPEIIDYHAAHNPGHSFAVFPRVDDPSAPTHISFLEFARAAQRFAHAVCPTAPVSHGEIVALVANADSILYATALAGLARAGLTAFPMSPRNSSAAICHMLRKVSAHRLMVTAASLGALLSEVKEELAASGYELSIEELPAFTDIYPHFGFETADMSFKSLALPSADAFVNNVPLILHSSGSTGFPKPIAWSHGFLASLTYGSFADELRDDERNIVMGTPGLPPFHTMGVFFHLLHPLYNGRPTVSFRPAYPSLPAVVSPETTLAALKASSATATAVVPTFLEVWVHDPEAVAFLSTLEFVGFGGGPLAAEVGDALTAAGCRLRSLFGATEFAVINNVYSHSAAPADWAWVAFHPNAHIRWAPAGDGSFELQLLAHDRHVLAVENLPDTRGYATNDLWVPHPTVPGLWKIVGRVDDVLVLANGEKVVPGSTEGTIVSHEAVRGAVMFGRGRNQVGVLVETNTVHAFDPADEAALAAFRNLIWPKVEDANRRQPAFARVFKEMILVTQPSKPLPRVGKGTVSRKGALALYDAEIHLLYEEVERPSKGAGVPPPEHWTTSELSRWVLALAAAIRDGSAVAPDGDLFAQRFDSLSATLLRNHIIMTLRGAPDDAARAAAGKIGNSFVYAHPSVRELAEALGALMQPGMDGAAPSAEDAVRAMVDKYAKDMPAMNKASTQPDATVVLLTGSTGGLGSQLLATLLSDPRVVKVFALNRPGKTSSKARHEATFRDRGLDEELLASEKVQFIEGDAAAEHLGLIKDLYEEIRSSVTVIIHNAWRLDFNLALSSFEPNVRGTRHLLDLALTATHASAARVLFTSSIAVTQAWPRANGPFPEAPQDDARWCLGSGYGEGKYVAEQLLVRAAEAGLQTTSFRIGQISGGRVNGAWATTDWLPIMVKSSISLGCLPAAEGLVSWLPFDAVCQAILDIVFAAVTPERALNLVHPRPIAWEKVIGAMLQVLETLGIHEHLALVDLQTWFGKLSEASRGADDATLRRIPAIKLLGFFEGMASADQAVRATTDPSRTEAGGLTMLATERAQAASEALRTLPSLGQADVERWVAYWKSKKFFDDAA